MIIIKQIIIGLFLPNRSPKNQTKTGASTPTNKE